MNQTAIRRMRRSASIAAAALRDPMTVKILREAGFAEDHSLSERPCECLAKTENPADSEDLSDDLPQRFFVGLSLGGLYGPHEADDDSCLSAE